MAFANPEFIIDNINSNDIGVNGVSLIRTDSQFSRSIMGKRSIKEDKSSNSDVPTFYGVESQPIEFELKFSLMDDEFTPEVLFELGKILGKNKYVSFQSSDYMGMIFYVVVLSANLVTWGTNKGWLSVKMRTSAPYAYTLKSISVHEITSVPATIELYNKSNVEEYYAPIVDIELTDGNTGVSLTNTSNGNRVFGFTGLNANESVTVDNKKEKITSSSGEPRFGKLIDKRWLTLPYGKNTVTVDSECIITVEYQYPVYI